MSDALNMPTVLLLNRNWQAIHVKTPADAFCMMAAGTAHGLDIHGGDEMTPIPWDRWLQLSVREGDKAVQTVRGPVRLPTVVVAVHYAKMPTRRPKFSSRAIWVRDNGTCQYTGRHLNPGEGNIDHVLPRSRGGKTSWDNCVLAYKHVNSVKSNRLPQEVGLKLLREPRPPREVPAIMMIRNHFSIPDWEYFLPQGATMASFMTE